MTPIEGCDYAYDRPKPELLAQAGKRFAVRYITPPGAGRKGLSQAEFDALRAAGLYVVAVWESDAGAALRGLRRGEQDAKAAQAALEKIVGLPDRAPVYFAVDFDATDVQMFAVRDYLNGAANVLGKERVGVYGSYRVVETVHANKGAAWYWQTYAWSDGKLSKYAHLHQYRNNVKLGGGTVDLVRALTTEYGQHPVAVAKPVTAQQGATVRDSTIILSRPGQRLEGVTCRRIVVQAAGVIIDRCVVTGEPGLKSNHGLINFTHPNAGGTITDTIVKPSHPTLWQTGVLGHDYTATRVTVRHCVDGFGVYNTHNHGGPVNVKIDRCDVDQLAYFVHDPTHFDKHSHNDCLQIQGGSNIVIKDSRLHAFTDDTVADGKRNPYRSASTGQAIAVTPNVAKVTGVTVTGCDLDGGAQSITIIPGKYGGATVGTFTGNRFGHGQHNKRAAAMAPAMHAMWGRNVYTDGGEAKLIVTTKL